MKPNFRMRSGVSHSALASSKNLKACSLSLAISTLSVGAYAQDQVEEVVVTGIRASLANALDEKRSADSLIEVIQAEDIGKLPDQNLAEVLENVTGIQITREAGVGTGVQIRGTDSNRIQINGVSTVGIENDRTGMSFEDIDASIISSLEVIKSPEAKTTEGSVGGTINLKTIRPLELKETLGSIRIQAEQSSLSSDGPTPRTSGSFGDNWDTDIGAIGIVLTGSYTESDNSAFRPRLDRDNLTECADGSTTCDGLPDGVTHFSGVQFLNQVQINQEYQTTNLAGAFEWAPNDNLKFYADAVLNNQERRQESSRVQFSNISRLNGQSDGNDGIWSNFETFEEFDLGSLPGPNGSQDLGSVYAVTSGTFTPQQLDDADVDRGAIFMRTTMDSGSRLTDTNLFRLGSEFNITDTFSGSVEVSNNESETTNPNLSFTLNFINPESDRFGTRDENGTPVIFDLRDGISFGINFEDEYAPTRQQLLDPANYVMDNGGTVSNNLRKNEENTVRADFSWDASQSVDAITSVDFGYRWNKRTSLRDNRSGSAGGTSNFDNSLNGAFVSELLTEIPDNFGDGTGSDLFVSGVLHFNPELAVNAGSFINAINNGITESGISQSQVDAELVSDQAEFFDIDEQSSALYAQVNFEYGIFRGNAGLRYVDTQLDSISFRRVFDQVGNASLARVEAGSSNSFLLPRINLIADVTDDVVIRTSYSKDINRPDFNFVTAARTLPNRGGVNDVSRVGNPNLEPEEIQSFDISAQWYFAEASLASIGYFHKKRTNLFGEQIEQPGDIGGGLREQEDIFGGDADGAPCALGGVFSDDTDAGIFGSGRGVCVGDATRFNADGSTSQSGIELSVQYSLGEFEEQLGWASGFGVIANYTYQDADVNTGFIRIGEVRAQDLYAAQGFDPETNPVFREKATLLNLSENSYNFTVFYEKYGFTARARYTYRDAYRTDDLPGTSNEFDPFGTRAVVRARGQLNTSISYDVTDNLSLGLDVVNLTESSQDISCINESAFLCYEGNTDRRIVAGASYNF